MSMLIVPEPLFDRAMAVEAYWLRSHNGKKMLGLQHNFHRMDAAFNNLGLDIVSSIGIEPFTGGKPLLVELTRMQLMAGVPTNAKIPPELLICVLPLELADDRSLGSILENLHERGYFLAFNGVPEPKAALLPFIDFIVLDRSSSRFSSEHSQAQRLHKLPIICNIPDRETFGSLRGNLDALFAGKFYSQPITKGKTKLSPVKVNALHLLNQVNQEDFDLQDIIKTIERDPYLSISLLRFINSSASGLSRKVDSIQQAVAILGQTAVRRWSTIALSTTLGEDRPSEITKLALVRAKFAEGLAGTFELGVFQPALFMAGLFSLLDVMLEKPMKEAIKELSVNDMVQKVLVERSGPLTPIMELVYAYERADWDRVSILMIQHNADMEIVSNTYLDALKWYRELLQSIDDESEPETPKKA